MQPRRAGVDILDDDADGLAESGLWGEGASCSKEPLNKLELLAFPEGFLTHPVVRTLDRG